MYLCRHDFCCIGGGDGGDAVGVHKGTLGGGEGWQHTPREYVREREEWKDAHVYCVYVDKHVWMYFGMCVFVCLSVPIWMVHKCGNLFR